MTELNKKELSYYSKSHLEEVINNNDNQFVLARDMLINSDSQSVVVGFLCSYDKAKDFPTYDWVKVTGEIIEGNYN